MRSAAVCQLLHLKSLNSLGNWGFLQDDEGNWQLTPFYDVTFGPHPFNQHATAYGGYTKAPPLKVMQKLAASAGFATWIDAKKCIKEVVEAISQFTHLAQQQESSKTTMLAIEKILIQRRQENTALLS